MYGEFSFAQGVVKTGQNVGYHVTTEPFSTWLLCPLNALWQSFYGFLLSSHPWNPELPIVWQAMLLLNNSLIRAVGLCSPSRVTTELLAASLINALLDHPISFIWMPFDSIFVVMVSPLYFQIIAPWDDFGHNFFIHSFIFTIEPFQKRFNNFLPDLSSGVFREAVSSPMFSLQTSGNSTVQLYLYWDLISN